MLGSDNARYVLRDIEHIFFTAEETDISDVSH